MDDVISLIRHLITAQYSIDRLESITHHLHISKEQILRIIKADRYKDYFQLLKSKTPGTEKLALTLDLFCCTHYAQQCKNQSCPFLHLCPYNIRPMHGKCTNKTCPYDHEVLRSVHNRKILNTRELTFLPDDLLLEIARASADPTRSFWVCTGHGKKDGCPKRTQCEKLHYCYYSLTNACTKPHCQHMINEACTAYFRRKELTDQVNEDILEAFRKVLRQRKPDYINTINIPPHPTWALPEVVVQKKSEVIVESSPASRSVLSASAPEYNGKIASKSNPLPPVPEDEQDILLQDSTDDYTNIEHYLTQEISYSIKLLISKAISSRSKNVPSYHHPSAPLYYYCALENWKDLFNLLRCQNASQFFNTPLVIYSNIVDAHEATEFNLENNQFCLLRLLLYASDLTDQTSLEIFDPSIICFDRLWIYVYNDQAIF